jgi:hypothetical protein
MNENDPSSVWTRYRNAKHNALAPASEAAVNENLPLTMEELERSIAETAASIGIPETGMPPRAVVHQPIQRHLSRWFYRGLVVLFASIIAGLIWWGYEHYGQG